MEKITFNKNFKVGKSSEIKELCGEIYVYFGKQIRYMQLYALVRDAGVKSSRETFERVKKAEFPNRVALLLSELVKQRAYFGDVNNSSIQKLRERG